MLAFTPILILLMYFISPEIGISIVGSAVYFSIYSLLFDQSKGIFMNRSMEFYGYIALLTVFCYLLSTFGKKLPTLSRTEKRKTNEQVCFLQQKVKKQKQLLYA